jgi:hypothetical protein
MKSAVNSERVLNCVQILTGISEQNDDRTVQLATPMHRGTAYSTLLTPEYVDLPQKQYALSRGIIKPARP